MAGMSELTYSLKTLFNRYQDTNLLNKLENYAMWTIPSVFPKDEYLGNFQNKQIEYDCQSIGAGLVFRLATKLASTLFPPNTSFFRMELNDDLKELFDDRQIGNIIEYENKACERLFLNASYAQLVQMMCLLIITGDCLLYRYNESLKVYSLRDYAVKRNQLGEVLDIVIQECKFWSELEPHAQALVGAKPDNDRLKMYTRVKRQYKNGHYSWKVTQEINGRDLGTDVVYPDKLCPYIPVTWSFVNGDNYGRGYVELYASDLYKLSRMSEALADYQFESLRVLHLVNPAGVFDTDSAESAPTGEYIQGDPNAVAPYEAGDAAKIQQIMLQLNEIEQRLNVAFMYTGNTREGERVTAYEISQNAQEAEQVLGGVYSQLSQNLHLPLAYLLLNEENDQIIHDINRKNLKLSILTGLQALSRSSENQNLVIACSELNATIPAFTSLGLSKKWNIDAVAEMIFSANGVNFKTLQYTEEEMQQMAQAEAEAQQVSQMQALAAQGGTQLTTQDNAVDAVSAAQGIV